MQADFTFDSHLIPRTTKWSAVFSERVRSKDVIEEAATTDKLACDKVVWAQAFISKKFAHRLQQRLRNSSVTCRRTLLNIKPPENFREWSPAWGSSTLCNL
jgi:hypothetical protein